MTDVLFKVTFDERDQLEQAASYVEVAGRTTPALAAQLLLFTDGEPPGRSLYTNETGLRLLHGMFGTPPAERIRLRDLPAGTVRRFGNIRPNKS